MSSKTITIELYRNVNFFRYFAQIKTPSDYIQPQNISTKDILISDILAD